MKKHFFILLWILAIFWLSSCASASRPYAVFPVAEKQGFTADGLNFEFRYIPSGITFPTGLDDKGRASVKNAYWIAETELTWELWDRVEAWATKNGYVFANKAKMGSEEAGSKQEPVTYISWRDSLVFCNALTEWYNTTAKPKTKLKPVYYSDSSYKTVIKTASDKPVEKVIKQGSDDAPYVLEIADGFRLPTMLEWELAARLSDSNLNTVPDISVTIDKKAWYFTKGNSASGSKLALYDAEVHDKKTSDKDQAIKAENDRLAVYNWYWNGSVWAYTQINKAAPVKTLAPNSLGLYDMSGNVWEWCFDIYPDDIFYRSLRGGSWYNSADFIVISYLGKDIPTERNTQLGIRIVRTAY